MAKFGNNNKWFSASNSSGFRYPLRGTFAPLDCNSSSEEHEAATTNFQTPKPMMMKWKLLPNARNGRVGEPAATRCMMRGASCVWTNIKNMVA